MNETTPSPAGSERRRYRFGLMLVSASAIAWSTAGFFTRLIALDSWTMLVWRGFIGGLGILLFIILRGRGRAFRRFRDMGPVSWSFTVISGLGMLCFVSALRLTTVAHVAVIYATVPFLAAMLAWIAMRERPSTTAIAGACGALAGVGVMVGFGVEGTLAGDLLAFVMTMAMASIMVIARRFQGIPIVEAACLSAFLSALASLPFASYDRVGGMQLLDLALFGLVNSALGIVLFALGSRLLPAIDTALVGSLDAPLAPIWVWLAFGETPRTATLIGGLIVFAAVFAHILSSAIPARSAASGACERQPSLWGIFRRFRPTS